MMTLGRNPSVDAVTGEPFATVFALDKDGRCGSVVARFYGDDCKTNAQLFLGSRQLLAAANRLLARPAARSHAFTALADAVRACEGGTL